MHLLEFNKEKKILKGAVQLELLVEETYYIHVVLLLCEAIKEKKHIPFVVCTLQDYITELQPVWQKMLPSDGYYYLSKNRREKIPVAYFTDFLDGLAPKNKMQKLNFDPLVGGAHYLVAQLMNIYLFTLAHAVRVKLNWRAALPVIDLEVKRLQEALVFPLVEKLVSEAFSVTSLVKPKVLLGVAHAIDVSLAGLAAEFKKLGQDTNDIDELLKCLRFSYAFLDVSLQNANTPAVKK